MMPGNDSTYTLNTGVDADLDHGPDDAADPVEADNDIADANEQDGDDLGHGGDDDGDGDDDELSALEQAARGGPGLENEEGDEGDGAEASVATPPPTDPRDLRIRFLEKKLSDNEVTLHAYIKAHKKAEAEFDAFKARLRRDQELELKRAKGKVVGRLLEVDENLDRTIDAISRGGAVESLLEGVKLVHRMFLDRLVELGLERVDPTGQPFNPSSMEAMGIVPVANAAQDNTVINVFKAGYRFGDVEIRPALVQVGRKM